MKISRSIFVLALLVLTLVAITPAFAGDREQMADAYWTGPLETSNANVIPKNHFYLEQYFGVEQDNGAYDAKGNQYRKPYDNEYWGLPFVAYGVTNRFNLQVESYIYGDQSKETGGASSNGNISVGMMKVRTPYQIYKYKEGNWKPSFTIVPGFLTPVSNGSVWQPWFGLWALRPFWMPNGRILRVRANQEFYFPLNGELSQSKCPAGTGGSCSFSGGKYAKTLVGMEYSLTKHWVPAWDFYWKYGAQTTAKGANGTPVTYASSYQSLVIDPALEYNFTDNVGIIFGVEMTVSGRNTGSYINPMIALQMFK